MSQVQKGNSLGQKYEKWSLIDKQVEIEEEKEEASRDDYSKEAASIKDLMGCGRDHSKEIDIYEKTFEEKVNRVK